MQTINLFSSERERRGDRLDNKNFLVDKMHIYIQKKKIGGSWPRHIYPKLHPHLP